MFIHVHVHMHYFLTVHIICTMIYMYVYVYYFSGAKLGFCILSNTCMGLGINAIALLEVRDEGVQWNNFYQDISLDDDFSLGYVFLMLIIDSLVYMLIAWSVNYMYIPGTGLETAHITRFRNLGQ